MHYDRYKYSDTNYKYTDTHTNTFANTGHSSLSMGQAAEQGQGKPGRPGALRAGPYYYYESLGLCPKMQNFLSSAAFT